MKRFFMFAVVALCAAAAPLAAQPAAKPAELKKVLAPINLALGRPATASSEEHKGEQVNAAKLAVDDKADTRWCASDGTVPQWWQVDLEKPQEIAGFAISWENPALAYRYHIEGSIDGKAWQKLVDVTDKGADSAAVHKASATARFVKVTVNGTKPGAFVSMWEFEVHGKQMVEKLIDVAKPAVAKVKGGGAIPAIKAPPGFDVTLFAAPPDVGYPTCVAVGPAGEVYVGVDENGSLDAKPKRGRVVRCIDADGDGKADKFNTFAEMDSPRGVFFDHRTLYVLHPPDLTAFHDDDGDGKADRSETLVKGIGFDLKFRGADHTTNGFRVGIDGFMYIAVGDYGFVKATGKDGRSLQLHGGGVVRVRLDGTGLEIVSRGQRNIYDVAVDPFLNLFTRDNTNDGGGWNVRLSHVVPLGNYGYPSLYINFGEDIIKPLMDYGGGSPCGALYLQEAAVPAPFGDALYTVEWGRGGVFRHPLTKDGASFKADQQEFINISRPTDMDVDAAGNIYVTSWHGGQFKYEGPNVGFVIRVKTSDAKPVKLPEYGKGTDSELLALINTPSATQRQYAQRELLRRGDKPAISEKIEWIAGDKSAALASRVAAVFTLKQLQGAKSHAALIKLLAHDELREHVLRALVDDDRLADAVPTKVLVDALADANPRVRLIAAIGAARLVKKDAADALLPLVADGDAVVAHVAVHAMVQLKAIEPALKAFDSAAAARLAAGAARVLAGLHDPAAVDGLILRLGRASDPPVRVAIIGALCRLYHKEADWDGKWWSTRPDTRGPYFKLVTWEQSQKIGGVLQGLLGTSDAATQRVLLTELKRNRIDMAQSTALLIRQAEQNPSFKPAAIEMLASQTPVPAEALPLLEKTATSASDTAAVRAAALRGLQRAQGQGGLDAAVRAFAVLGATEKLDVDLQRAWEDFTRDAKHAGNIAAFARIAEDKDAARRVLGYVVLLHVAESRTAKKELKEQASRAIELAWAKPQAAAALLRAIGQAKAEHFGLQVSAHRGSKDAQVKDAAAFAAAELKLDAAGAGANKVTIEKMKYDDVFAAAMKQAGDAKAGAQLFLKQGCIACHTTLPSEPLKGPYLGDIATRYKRAELIESIVKPNAKIAQGFVTHRFETEEGDVIDGFIVRESGEEVEVRNIAGVSKVLKVGAITSRKKLETSIMPVNLVNTLSVEELASLVGYLESLKGGK